MLKPVPAAQKTGPDKWLQTPDRQEVFDYSYDGVMRSIEFSLERLGLNRIDILYVHDIDVSNLGTRENVFAKVDQLMSGGYHALERLRREGVIKAFGAGLNEWEVCQQLIERGDFDIFLLAGRYTLLEQEALETVLPLCQKRNIAITIGGPYNSGILASGPKPGAWYNYEPAPEAILDRVRRIEAICQDHAVRLVDAAFQFPLGHPCVKSVIPGGQSVDQMDSNLQAANATIPSALWSDLKEAELIRQDAPMP